MLKTILFMTAASALAGAQDFDTHILDKYESKASDTVNVNLTGMPLRLAAKFISDDDPDSRKVKRILAGVKGIHVKSLEFDTEGAYSQQDLNAIRSRMNGSEWMRIVGVHCRQPGDSADVFLRMGGKESQVRGIAIIAAGPKNLTVVRIDGTLDPEDLRDLGGHFSVPEMDVPDR